MAGWRSGSLPLRLLPRSHPVIGRNAKRNGGDRIESGGALTTALQISICFMGFQSITITNIRKIQNNRKSPDLCDQPQSGPASSPPSLVEPEGVAL